MHTSGDTIVMSTKKSLAEILKEKQQNRHKDLAKINEIAQARAKLDKAKKEQVCKA